MSSKEELIVLVLKILYFCIILANVIGGWSKFQLLDSKKKELLCFLVYTLILESVCVIVGSRSKLVPLLYNLYYYVALLFWGRYFSDLVNKKLRLIRIYILASSLLFSIYFDINGYGLFHKPNFVSIVMALALISFVLCYYYDEITQEMNTINSKFWIASGTMLWALYYIFYSMSVKFFYEMNQDFALVLYLILNVINLIYYSSILTAWFERKGVNA